MEAQETLFQNRPSIVQLQLVCKVWCPLAARDYNANRVHFFSVMCLVSLVLRLL